MNGIIGPLAEVLQFGIPAPWYREDVNRICGPPLLPLRFYNMRVPVLAIERM